MKNSITPTKSYIDKDGSFIIEFKENDINKLVKKFKGKRK
jgi:hypothetical protein